MSQQLRNTAATLLLPLVWGSQPEVLRDYLFCFYSGATPNSVVSRSLQFSLCAVEVSAQMLVFAAVYLFTLFIYWTFQEGAQGIEGHSWQLILILQLGSCQRPQGHGLNPGCFSFTHYVSFHQQNHPVFSKSTQNLNFSPPLTSGASYAFSQLSNNRSRLTSRSLLPNPVYQGARDSDQMKKLPVGPW